MKIKNAFLHLKKGLKEQITKMCKDTFYGGCKKSPETVK